VLKQPNIASRPGGQAKMRVFTAGFFSPLALGLAALAMASQAYAGQISSVYTSLNLDSCKLIASNPDEGGWAKWSCKGHKGMAVRVAEGDLRFFVSYGPNAEKQTAASQTLSPFNTINKTLEWRVERKGKAWVPFATILRISGIQTGARARRWLSPSLARRTPATWPISSPTAIGALTSRPAWPPIRARASSNAGIP
jgi:hypothetical protein